MDPDQTLSNHGQPVYKKISDPRGLSDPAPGAIYMYITNTVF